MATLSEFATVVSYAPLVMVFVLAGELTAKDLRPSDHGLVFQNSPPSGVNYPPEMMSFFNGKGTSTSSGMALPKAMNSSDSSPTSWWRGTGSSGGDHVRDALMVASLVCGITGVILLAASCILYLFKYRKHKLNESSRDNNNNNKMELVVRDP